MDPRASDPRDDLDPDMNPLSAVWSSGGWVCLLSGVPVWLLSGRPDGLVISAIGVLLLAVAVRRQAQERRRLTPPGLPQVDGEEDRLVVPPVVAETVAVPEIEEHHQRTSHLWPTAPLREPPAPDDPSEAHFDLVAWHGLREIIDTSRTFHELADRIRAGVVAGTGGYFPAALTFIEKRDPRGLNHRAEFLLLAALDRMSDDPETTAHRQALRPD